MEYRLKFKDYDAALREDRLLGLKCRDCGAITVPPKMVCRQCGSPELEIVELTGHGKIRTFTTVCVAPEGREDEAPYIIVLVELVEGPWLMGNLNGISPEAASMELIGRPVKLGHDIFPGDKYSAGEAARPVFRLV